MTDVTSNIQAQLNGKMGSGSWCTTKPTTTGTSSSSKPCVIIENYKNGENWYRKWSDGFIEQGGLIEEAYAGGQQTITLNKAFAGTDYTVVGDVYYDGTGGVQPAQVWVYKDTRTTTSFKTFYTGKKFWYACGF